MSSATSSGIPSDRAGSVSPPTSACASAPVSIPSSPQIQARKKRNNLSCTQCKVRKIRCDRNIPNCQSCVRRGVQHLCRWGDERDDLIFLPPAQQAPVPHPSSSQSSSSTLTRPYDPTPSCGLEPPSLKRARTSDVVESVASIASSHPSATPVSHEDTIGTIVNEVMRRLSSSDVSVIPSIHRPEQNGHSHRGSYPGSSKASSSNGSSSSRPFKYPNAPPGVSMAVDSVNWQSYRPSPAWSPSMSSTTSSSKSARFHSYEQESTSGRSIRTRSDSSNGSVSTARESLPRMGSQTPFTELARFLGKMPSREHMYALVHFYLAELEPLVNCFNSNVLLEQVDQYLTWAAEVKALDAGQHPHHYPWPDANSGAAASKSSHSLATRISGSLSKQGLPHRGQKPSFMNALASPQVPPIPIDVAPSPNHSSNGSTSSSSSAQGLLTPSNYGLLALMCSVIITSCEAMTLAQVATVGYLPGAGSVEQVQALFDEYAAGTLDWLAMSDYLENPTISTLQTIFLLERRWLNQLLVSTCATWISIAIRLARSLGLHLLGSAAQDLERVGSGSGTSSGAPSREEQGRGESNPSPKAHDDVWSTKDQLASLSQRMLTNKPGGKGGALKMVEETDLALRELGRKVWHALISFDWFLSAHSDHCYSVHDQWNHTSAPMDLEDDEVVLLSRESRTSHRFRERLLDAAQASRQTFVSINTAIARATREQVDIEQQAMVTKRSIEYDEVLAIDRNYRCILDSLPDCFRLDGHCERLGSVMEQHAKRPSLAIQRVFLQEQVHHRLLKLHRPFLGKGFQDERYRLSAETCIEAAGVTLAVLAELERVSNPNQRLWNLKPHVFHAALVLQLALLYFSKLPDDPDARSHEAPPPLVSQEDALEFNVKIRRGIEFIRNCERNASEKTRSFEGPLRLLAKLSKEVQDAFDSKGSGGGGHFSIPSDLLFKPLVHPPRIPTAAGTAELSSNQSLVPAPSSNSSSFLRIPNPSSADDEDASAASKGSSTTTTCSTTSPRLAHDAIATTPGAWLRSAADAAQNDVDPSETNVRPADEDAQQQQQQESTQQLIDTLLLDATAFDFMDLNTCDAALGFDLSFLSEPFFAATPQRLVVQE
ncbi:hypothetical protein IE53DRAFT_383675 [Violaceomyces palustris]|uniref:Uncharacterized protein n=1 Tax=Violaceomyces palustris TaxID=1673888 RepID=A0ACD0P6Z8_9BASI|nr:hypothetical protein IE53DRAFT_383675 [Violaceomyces palustris]